MPGAPGLAHRLEDQPVRVLVVARADVVGLLEEDRVDLGGVDELGQLDDLAAVARRGLDLVLVEDDVLALGELVALDGV